MSSTLREMAAANGHTDEPAADEEVRAPRTELVPFAEPAELTTEDPPAVTVYVAWARVMRGIEALAKRSVYSAPGQRYNFRGVDAVLNAFGPVCRRHGVIVVPHEVRPSHALATSKGGASMRETTVVVCWRIYGPMGDFIEGQSEGESLDTGDKGTAKAQSVALRVFILAAAMLPTDERDPDSIHYERGERPTVNPNQYRDEIADPVTSAGRLRQIRTEINRHGIAQAIVTNEVGDDEGLLKMVVRIGQERATAEDKTAAPDREAS